MYLCNERYKVIGRLGSGGFSEVYLAEDRVLHKTWAVKVISVHDMPEEVQKDTARNELGILTRVSHPGIVRITDVFISEERVCIVMDHVKGMDLQRLMESRKKIPRKTKYKWMNEICDALEYLHGMEPTIVVGDLKPKNIMIRPDGHAVLIDFGAASDRAATVDDYVFASRGYASPEQIEGKGADVRSDIYALGRVIGFLTGDGSSPWMKLIVKKCTARDPDRRYQSVAAVKRDLIMAWGMKYLIVAAAVLTATVVAVTAHMRRSNASVNDMARMEQAYSQALMCFYDMQDYDSAAKYLEEVSEEVYPEAAYYREMTRLCLADEPDTKAVESVMKEFERFNEDSIGDIGAERYVKNVLCMASVWVAEPGKDEAGSYRAERMIRQALGKAKDGIIPAREEGALLDMLIGIMLEREREDDGSPETDRDELLKAMDRRVSIAEDTGDTAAAVAYLMDKAAYLAGTGEYREALDVYGQAEDEYPKDAGIRYASQMSLMMKLGYDIRDVEKVWSLAEEAGVTDDDNAYRLIRERMDTYESDKEEHDETETDDDTAFFPGGGDLPV